MAINMVRVGADQVRAFTYEAFRAMGLDDEQAAISAGALLFSELRFHPGQGQGVRRLRAYRDRLSAGQIDAKARFEIVKESPALALVDAHNGLGSVTGVRAMRLAVVKAKLCGIGSVLVRGGTHYGSSAVHAAEAVNADCIGLAMTNAGAEMAAWGGATPVVGTNPWAIAAPSDRGFAVSLDIALTTAGTGMMRWHQREGRPMPRDWALTPAGEETDDPAAAMEGALLGIGQYKGYGLSFMTDALTGVLSGGGFGTQPYTDPMRQDVSHVFVAYDVAWFLDVAEYKARMGAFIDMVKASRLRPGFSEVLVPGELEERRAQEKLRSGIPLDAAVYEDLNRLGRELGIEGLGELAVA